MICVYENLKDLPKRKASDKVLHEKAIDIAKPPRFDGYHCELASMIYKFLIKSLQTNNQQKHYTK